MRLLAPLGPQAEPISPAGNQERSDHLRGVRGWSRLPGGTDSPRIPPPWPDTPGVLEAWSLSPTTIQLFGSVQADSEGSLGKECIWFVYWFESRSITLSLVPEAHTINQIITKWL